MTTQIRLYPTARVTGRDASRVESIGAWRTGADPLAHRQTRDRQTRGTSSTVSSLAAASTSAAADQQTLVILDPSISWVSANPASPYDYSANASDASTSASDASIVAAPVLAADRALDSFAQYDNHLNGLPANFSPGASSALANESLASLPGESSSLSSLDAALGNSGSRLDVSFFPSPADALCAADRDFTFANYFAHDAGATISASSFSAISNTTDGGATSRATVSAWQGFDTVLTIDFSASSDSGDAFSVLRAGGPAPARQQAMVPPQFSVPVTVTTQPTVTLTVAADKQTVVILDTGISSTISNLIYQYDFVGNDTNASTTVTHGSIVASQVLAADSQANIIVLKVADDAGNISTAAVDSALDWVAKYASQLNIASVNLSFGASAVVSTATVTSLSDEFATLSSLDVAVVVAAGNSASKTGVSALSSDANVISVSASDGDLVFSSYSNRDADLTDLVADGTNIVYGTSTVSGTSFSAPLVAGAIADLKSEFYTTYGRELTVKEALLLLQATGDAMNTAGEVSGTSSTAGDGYVQLDLSASLAAVHDLTELTLIGIVV